ncbi:MAG: hypothetical protein Q4P06_09550 [Actinomycetaceae bacterium]|nr:hypothetical protein [Actinomycetaceae bacterium]
MRKLLASLLAVVMSVGLLSGCMTKTVSLKANFTITSDREISPEASALLLKLTDSLSNKVYYRVMANRQADSGQVDMSLPEGEYDVAYVSPVEPDGSIYQVEGSEKFVADANPDSSSSGDFSLTLTLRQPQTVTSGELEAIIEDIKAADQEGAFAAASEWSGTTISAEETLQTVNKALEEKLQEEQNNTTASEVYKDVLQDPKAYLPADVVSKLSSNSALTYTLVNIGEGKTPQLMLAITPHDNFGNSLSYLQVVEYDPTQNTLQVAGGEALSIGVAGAGGFRGSMRYNPYEKYLYHLTLSSGSGRSAINKVLLQNHAIVRELVGEYGPTDDRPDPSEQDLDIAWYDPKDFAPLEELAGKPWTYSVPDANTNTDPTKGSLGTGGF